MNIKPHGSQIMTTMIKALQYFLLLPMGIVIIYDDEEFDFLFLRRYGVRCGCFSDCDCEN